MIPDLLISIWNGLVWLLQNLVNLLKFIISIPGRIFDFLMLMFKPSKKLRTFKNRKK